VFKLDKFLVHYTEHQAADQNLDLLDFIYMHYLGDDMNNTDQERDMELPFKKMDDPFSFQVASFPESGFIPAGKMEIIDHYLIVLFRNDRAKSPTLDALFRPPCLA
jgi:hypothetical protein